MTPYWYTLPMSFITTFKQANVILVGAVAFVLGLLGMQLLQKTGVLPVYSSDGKCSLAMADNCERGQLSADEEVYFVSCGGLF